MAAALEAYRRYAAAVVAAVRGEADAPISGEQVQRVLEVLQDVDRLARRVTVEAAQDPPGTREPT